MNRFLFISMLFLLMSCAKTERDDYQTDMGYAYFPVKVGQYRIYSVDSILYSKSALPDTISCQIKETIAEKLDVNGEEVYRLVREWRPDTSFNWMANTVWWLAKEDNRVIQVEENLKFIKLTFPVKEGLKWDGNSFIDPTTKIKVGDENVAFFKEWDYNLIGMYRESILGKELDVVEVEESNFETSIELRYSTAKYAKDIGLVERVQKILDTQCITCTGDWTEKAEKGVIMVQTIIEHN